MKGIQHAIEVFVDVGVQPVGADSMMMAPSIEYGVPSRAVPCRNAVGGRLADIAVHRASRWSIALATPLATRPVRPDSDMYTMSGFGCA